MDDLIDRTSYVVDANDDGIALLVFDQLATEIDLTPPDVDVQPPPLWEWDTVPPLSVLIREVARTLRPDEENFTGWLFSLQELARYEAQQERLAAHNDDA